MTPLWATTLSLCQILNSTERFGSFWHPSLHQFIYSIKTSFRKLFSLHLFYSLIAIQFQKCMGCCLQANLTPIHLFLNRDYSDDRLVFEIGQQQSSSCLVIIRLPCFLKTHVNPLLTFVPLAISSSFSLVSVENAKNLDDRLRLILKLSVLFSQHLEIAFWIFFQLLLSPFYPSWLRFPFSSVPIVSALCACCILFYLRLLRLSVFFLWVCLWTYMDSIGRVSIGIPNLHHHLRQNVCPLK